AKLLEINKSGVSRHLKRIEERGGLTTYYRDLWDPFSPPLVQELFDACKGRNRPVSADAASKIMADVRAYARKVDKKDWLNAQRIRKALQSCKSDSRVEIASCMKTAIARAAVRKNAVVHRLAIKILDDGLHIEPRDKPGVLVRIRRYPTAVSIAFHIMKRLRANGAPSKVKGDIDWIRSQIRDKHSYSEILGAPGDASATVSGRTQEYTAEPVCAVVSSQYPIISSGCTPQSIKLARSLARTTF
ncbi:MAG TPA: hypothetical protein VGE93_05910, partial [Bryobacteraceae bacterium]